jgi:hypothetical protein
MVTKSAEEHRTELLNLARDDCLNLGRERPFMACCVAQNGDVSVFILDIGQEPKLLRGHGRLERPMTIVVIDRRDEPAVFTVDMSGWLKLRPLKSDRDGPLPARP